MTRLPNDLCCAELPALMVLQPAHHEQDDQDDQEQSTGAVVISATGPAAAAERQDKENNENNSECADGERTDELVSCVSRPRSAESCQPIPLTKFTEGWRAAVILISRFTKAVPRARVRCAETAPSPLGRGCAKTQRAPCVSAGCPRVCELPRRFPGSRRTAPGDYLVPPQ